MNVKRLEGHGFHLYQDTRVKIHSERYVTVRIVYVVVRNVASVRYIVTKRLEHVHGMGSLRLMTKKNRPAITTTVCKKTPKTVYAAVLYVHPTKRTAMPVKASATRHHIVWTVPTTVLVCVVPIRVKRVNF